MIPLRMSPRVVSSLSPTITPEDSRDELRGARDGEMRKHRDRAGALAGPRGSAARTRPHRARAAASLSARAKVSRYHFRSRPALVVDEGDEASRRRVVLGAQAPADHGRRAACAP